MYLTLSTHIGNRDEARAICALTDEPLVRRETDAIFFIPHPEKFS